MARACVLASVLLLCISFAAANDAEEDLLQALVQDATTVEVDMATTKVFEGVPVFNYHLANPSGMEPSLIELSEPKKFIINFKGSFTDGDEKAFCANPPGNSLCQPSGSPSEGGIPFVEFTGTEEELKQIIKNHPDLKPDFAEPDAPVSIVPEIGETEQGSLLETGEDEESKVPWGVDRVDDKKGLDSSYSLPWSKQGVGAHVYVADTGVKVDHVDFEGRAIPGIEALSSTVKVCSPTDKNCAADRHGHGTHCAGTVGGKKYGVAKKTALYAVKVLGDRGSGSFSGIIKSVDWIAANGKKPAVWSASLGGRGVMHSIEKTFGAAMNKGVTVVVASGNSRGDACGYTPAFAPSAITVGATSLQGSMDARTGFSNYGKCVDILAPGYQIESASHRSTTGSAKMSGTSMACPHVAGGVALLLGDNPSMSPQAVDKTLKANALKNVVSDAKGPNLFLYVANQPAPAPMPAPTPAPPAPAPTPGSQAPMLVVADRGCKNQVRNFGTQPDPHTCAVQVRASSGCGHRFMFSHSYPSWGCRCCSPGDPGSSVTHVHWDVYSTQQAQYVMRAGSVCPAGLSITDVAGCQTAWTYLNKIGTKFKQPSKRGMVKGNWNGVPPACSVQYQGGYVDSRKDSSPHFNTRTSSSNTRLTSGEFRVICKASAPMPAPTPAPPAPAPTPGSSGSWQQIQEMGKRLNNLEALLAAIVKKLQSRTTTTDLPTTTTDLWAAPTTTTMPNLVNTYTTTAPNAPPTIAPSPGIPPAVRDQMNKMHSRMSSMEGMLQRILAAIKARGGNR